jgi:diguanylate cyclase (GGDEF)-like protein
MGPPVPGSGAAGQFAVQRPAPHADDRPQPGDPPAGPWSGPLRSASRPLAGYLLAVVAADLVLTGWQLTCTSPRREQVLLFAALLSCGAICVEATRRWGVPPPGTRDLLSVWWLPAALLLPPLYALTAPALIAGLAHWRAARGPVHWRAFTAAALGLAGAVASAVFHLSGPHGRWFLHPATLVTAAACAVLFVTANAALVAIAVLAAGPEANPAAGPAAGPETTGRSAPWDAECLLLDLTGLCAGVLVTIACALSPVLLALALPPVILLQRSLLHQQLRTAARTDAKTGLLNAVAWQREADSRIRRAQRTGQPVALLLADIDHFKRVNDTYGHLAGDEVLIGTATTLVRHVRAGDVSGRFGGEEFVVLLPGADGREACLIAERLRERVAAITLPAAGAEMTVTVSIGVAALGTHGSELFELLAAADAAVYRAKESGRDQVCLLPPRVHPSQAQPRRP